VGAKGNITYRHKNANVNEICCSPAGKAKAVDDICGAEKPRWEN